MDEQKRLKSPDHEPEVSCFMFHVWFSEFGFCQDPITSVPKFFTATWNPQKSSDVHTQKSQEMSSSEEHAGRCITQLLRTVWSSLHQSYSLLLYFYLASSWVLRTNRVYFIVSFWSLSWFVKFHNHTFKIWKYLVRSRYKLNYIASIPKALYDQTNINFFWLWCKFQIKIKL